MASNLRVDEGLPLNTNPNPDGNTENLVVDFGSGANYSLGATQVLALSATAVASTAIGTSPSKYRVRLVGNSAFHVAVGAAPTAASGDPLFPASNPEVIVVTGGQKVSVLQDSASGSVYLTEISYP